MTAGVGQYEVIESADSADSNPQRAARERAAAAAAAANADPSRSEAYRCATSAHTCFASCRGALLSPDPADCTPVPTQLQVLNRLGPVRRLDTGDGVTIEEESFLGRIYLAAASQLPKVPFHA